MSTKQVRLSPQSEVRLLVLLPGTGLGGTIANKGLEKCLTSKSACRSPEDLSSVLRDGVV